MRFLSSTLHLVVTVWVAYIVPVILLGGLIGYFPGFPEAAHTPTYIALAIGAAFFGGTILGRTRAWRGRAILLSGIAWLLAAAVSVPSLFKGSGEAVTSDGLVAPVALDLAPLLLSLGLSVGLNIGARFMRPFDREAEPPRKSKTGTPGENHEVR
jgi:hypothetical protein